MNDMVVEIKPHDETIAVRLKALQVLNGYRKLGFTSRKAFVNTVADIAPELNNEEGRTRLVNFWKSRDYTLSERLEKVLDHLKAS